MCFYGSRYGSYTKFTWVRSGDKPRPYPHQFLIPYTTFILILSRLDFKVIANQALIMSVLMSFHVGDTTYQNISYEGSMQGLDTTSHEDDTLMTSSGKEQDVQHTLHTSAAVAHTS